ncbi:hypothetical protein JKP88DRAFT_266286 [Tribonema minus]|uniref:Uncharacterized protein n=1 Tax=Tribonema minus TaxID=303371 RepID=A0A835ZED5_9STRA|nr:hypothetical protein JKP88DRAFT_266286 [Tribonema minus]
MPKEAWLRPECADRMVPLKSCASSEGSVSVSMCSDSLPIVLFHITDRTSREGSCRLCWPGTQKAGKLSVIEAPIPCSLACCAPEVCAKPSTGNKLAPARLSLSMLKSKDLSRVYAPKHVLLQLLLIWRQNARQVLSRVHLLISPRTADPAVTGKPVDAFKPLRHALIYFKLTYGKALLTSAIASLLFIDFEPLFRQSPNSEGATYHSPDHQHGRPVDTTASDANSSSPGEEVNPPAVLNSNSGTHAAPTRLRSRMVNPTCLSNKGDAVTQQAAAGSGHDMANGDHSSGTALAAATEPSAAGAPPSTLVAKAPSARSSGARHPSRQCTHCGMLGHLVDRCWQLHSQLRRKTSPVEPASTAPASGEQSSAAQTPTKRRDGDNTHRHAGARLRAIAGSKSSTRASNHTASKEEHALCKQVARLKQDAAVLRERLAGLKSRRKESAVPADAQAASCCSRQQSTALRAALQAIVQLCQQLLAGAADAKSGFAL